MYYVGRRAQARCRGRKGHSPNRRGGAGPCSLDAKTPIHLENFHRRQLSRLFAPPSEQLQLSRLINPTNRQNAWRCHCSGRRGRPLQISVLRSPLRPNQKLQIANRCPSPSRSAGKRNSEPSKDELSWSLPSWPAITTTNHNQRARQQRKKKMGAGARGSKDFR